MTLLKKKAVLLDADINDPIEAIKVSGHLLMEARCATEEYVDAMIKGFQDVGPYIVIAPGIAIPHARPENGALKKGFSLLRLKNPIAFGHDKNDPVKLVCAIAGVGNTGHIEMLQEIAMILGDKERLNQILTAKSFGDLEKIITI